jgi:hypothetical protein
VSPHLSRRSPPNNPRVSVGRSGKKRDPIDQQPAVSGIGSEFMEDMWGECSRYL